MASPAVTFKLVVLAPFHPLPEAGYRPRLIAARDLAEAYPALAPSFYIPLDKGLSREGGIALSPKSLDDFHPDGMIAGHPYLASLKDALDYLKGEGRNAPPDQAARRLKEWPLLPIDIKAPAAAPAAAGSSAIDDLLSMVSASPAATGPAAGGEGVDKWTADLEGVLQRILGEIFADPAFRLHEAAWRGLGLLMGAAGAPLEIQLAAVSLSTLGEALGHLEGELFARPPSAILIDLPFDSSGMHFDLFAKLAETAGNLLAPIVTSIGPEFFRLQDWDGLAKLPFLPHFIDDAGFAKWRRLPKDPGAEWLSVLANRVLARPAYGKRNPIRTVPFAEPEPLFIGPVWALARLLAERIAETGWPTRFTGRGFKGPAIPAGSEIGPVEAAFPSDRLEQFTRIGVSPFFRAPGKDIALLPEAVTLAGVPLENQFILSRLINTIIALKDNAEPGMDPSDIERTIGSGVAALFGDNPPDGLEVRAEPDGRGGNLVAIAFTPPREVSASGKRIELNIGW